MMTTAAVPPWLRRSDQAVTGRSTMLLPGSVPRSLEYPSGPTVVLGPSALSGLRIGAETDPMAWYFRVVEQEDRSWICRHGRCVFDTHRTLVDALDHITVLAAAHRPAEVFVHRIDGSVEGLGGPA